MTIESYKKIKLPAKIMIDPRSIWKEEAEVKVNAMYMIEVAVTSHKAGK